MKKQTAKKEFTSNDMPHNRLEVFFDILKNRLSTLLLLGFIIFIFSLPLILIDYLTNITLNNIGSHDTEYFDVQLIIHSQNLLYILGFIILGIGLSGVFKIIRLLIWQEGIIFWADFKDGIKSNCKDFIITALIIGIFNFLFHYIYYDKELNQYAFLAIVVAIIFFLPTIIFTLGQTVIYNLNYLAKTKNSFLLAWRVWYTSVPVALLNGGVIFLLLIPNPTTYLILLITLPIIIAPLLILFNTLYTDTQFDNYINKGNFDEIIDKGIYRNGTN